MHAPLLLQSISTPGVVAADVSEESYESKDGQVFNLHADRWQLTAHKSMNVGELRSLSMSPMLRDNAIRTLAHIAAKYSAGTAKANLQLLKKFLSFASKQVQLESLSPILLINYRAHCREKYKNECHISQGVRPILRTWFTLGYDGVPIESIEMLNSWTLKGPERNVAVNRLDTNEGPLMPDENIALASEWLTAFESGALRLEDYVIARLLSVTGRRPEQIVQLKCMDMDDSRQELGEPGQPARRLLLLHVPRIKGKGGIWRARSRAVPISNDLWNLVATQRATVWTRFNAVLEESGVKFQASELADIQKELPLIPEWKAVESYQQPFSNAVSSHCREEIFKEMLKLAQSDAWHKAAQRVNDVFRRLSRTIHALNRDGRPMRVFPRRMRYTHEFNLELAGCQPSVIAWNMDHSSIESIASYSKNGPDKAREIDKAMALKLVPFIKMFQGRVVDHESNAEGGDHPEDSRIFIDNVTPGATCATKRGCGMTGIPRPCYGGCPHFRPWVDGPHEEFLESLLEERRRDIKFLHPERDRAVIEAADSLIWNVVQVIRLCEVRRVGLAQANQVAGVKAKSRGLTR